MLAQGTVRCGNSLLRCGGSCWLKVRCGGSYLEEVAHNELWWLMERCGSSLLRCGGSWRDVVAHI